MKFCGICHTDVHFAEKTSAISKVTKIYQKLWKHEKWTKTNFENVDQYPLVPGHELAGVVTMGGANIKDIKVKK